MENKQITLKFEGATYTLTFTRRTVQQLSRAGFKMDMVTEQPALGIPMLFRGAFLANHRGIRDDLTDKIYKAIPQKQDFISKLMELYAEPINVMFEDPEEEDEKKADWEANY